MNDRVTLHFSNGQEMVEIEVSRDEAFVISDAISQISECAVKNNEIYTKMEVFVGLTADIDWRIHR
jgi:hypothetical protein